MNEFIWHREGHPDKMEMVVCIWYDANPSICYWNDGWFYYDEDEREAVSLETPDYWIELPKDEGLYRK